VTRMLLELGLQELYVTDTVFTRQEVMTAVVKADQHCCSADTVELQDALNVSAQKHLLHHGSRNL
jgi:hypothetical protein